MVNVFATLTDLTTEKTKLLTTISRKIAASKTTRLNEDIDNKLRVDITVIRQLLQSFESRLRECEMLYYMYLKDADHAILSGDITGLPFRLHVELNFSSSVLEKDIMINDKDLYKDVVDSQFRHFILAMSSLYEVLVKLAEILIRKVVLHLPGKRPLSAPLDQYIQFLKSLVELRYRRRDNHYHCIQSNEPFLDRYLSTITLLRNSFMHGYSTNLNSDTVNYKVTTFDTAKFTTMSPELNVDLFSTTVIQESRKFFIEMLEALENSIRHPTKFIPA